MEELKKASTMESKAAGCAFILTTYSFFLLSFGLASSIQNNDEVYYQLPRLAIIFTFFAFFYTALYLTASMFLSWKLKYD
jgi:hypothetical protein